MSKETKANAAKLADLTFNLLEDCHQKEIQLAKRYGLTTAEFHCLRLLNIGEKINNKDLAKRLQLSAGRLSRIANGLVEKNYVNRELDTHDRRNLYYSLSERGEDMVGQLRDAYIVIHEEILANMDTTIHKDLISGMTELLSALRKWMNRSTE